LSGANTATAGFTAPTVSAATVFTFRLTVTDNLGVPDTDEVNVTVQTTTPPNQPPVTVNACVSTPVNTSVTGNLSATDPEGQPLMYSLATQGSKGAVNLDIAGNYAYTPNSPNFRGMDKFTYQVTDPEGLTSTGSVWVIIDGSIRIMPLGDSITAGIASGTSPASANRIGYRKDLYDSLTTLSAGKYGIDFVGSQSDGSNFLFDTNHEGHPGWCDDNSPFCTVSSGANIAASVTGFLISNPPDIVLLHIGTNEFNVDNSGVDSILTSISAWALANYPVTVFVARIIPTANGTLDVSTFNTNVAVIATDRPAVKVYHVDQQGTLQIPGQPNTADSTLMTDNLHPNQTGYDKMADKWKADLIILGVLPSCP
jgi:hypothetical protein